MIGNDSETQMKRYEAKLLVLITPVNKFNKLNESNFVLQVC